MIDIAENPSETTGLIVVFETHTEHVQKNKYHYNYFKFLIRRYVKEKTGDSKLED